MIILLGAFDILCVKQAGQKKTRHTRLVLNIIRAHLNAERDPMLFHC